MILILNGSPNKDSKTMRVVNLLLEDNNQDVKLINAYQKDVSSCDDCQYCNHTIGCKQNDDMNDIITKMYKADTLIISSPIYFGGLSDQVMKIINRFQRFYSQKWVLKDPNIPSFKNIILVSTQGSDKMRMFNGALETLNILDKLFEPEYINKILVPESDLKNYISDDIKEEIMMTRKKMIK